MTADVLDLGIVDYKAALELQRSLASKRAAGLAPDTLLLLEHGHVITLGRKTSQTNLRPQSIPVYEVERGGDATYHGPGQLVGYSIFGLPDHDVRRLVRTIEEALIGVSETFGLHGELLEGHPGVWVGGRKLASIGVAVVDWVSYHGFALNVNTQMSYFELIRPCGLDPSSMTSMEVELGRRLDLDAVKTETVRQFTRAFRQDFVPKDLRELGLIVK